MYIIFDQKNFNQYTYLKFHTSKFLSILFQLIYFSLLNKLCKLHAKINKE